MAAVDGDGESHDLRSILSGDGGRDFLVRNNGDQGGRRRFSRPLVSSAAIWPGTGHVLTGEGTKLLFWSSGWTRRRVRCVSTHGWDAGLSFRGLTSAADLR
ncbi:hypothetical protein Taro_012009 [Colocasia esculenta]|uniref:Uncharacterized protein n=1 Tax=Colocasia esculenta TaxID=4460 RepID=A0A843UCD6_COLES|nr:hypothetical protein [Colocasia esculenta]